MSKGKKIFHFKHVTQEGIDRERKEIVSNIKEEDKSIFLFEGEYFYLVGGGHNFIRGFYREYATKKGLFATQYAGGLWVIGGENYDYENNTFIKRPEVEVHNFDFSGANLSFPVIKNVPARTIAEDIQPVKPKKRP